jgi:aminopeptidase C
MIHGSLLDMAFALLGPHSPDESDSVNRFKAEAFWTKDQGAWGKMS